MRRFLISALASSLVILPTAQVLAQSAEADARSPLAPVGIESYVREDFEGQTFPPPGWTLEYTGSLFWKLFHGASAYGVGSASATFDVLYTDFGTTQSLVLSSMGVSRPGDSLRFDHAYASWSGAENDRLVIEASANGGVTYTTLASLDGGTSGPLVTAPPQTPVFVPSALQWATKRYALPVNTNRVRFKFVCEWGNNLYIDNCTIGSQTVHDAGVQSIDIPGAIMASPRMPKVTVQNHGSASETFSVTLHISPDGYSSVKTVTALAANQESTVLFDNWTPTNGTHTLTAFTTLTGDVDLSNDTLRSMAVVNAVQQVTNIDAAQRAGQAFVTWDNLAMSNVIYTLYRTQTPIQHGFQLSSAQNLGDVRDNSGLDKRLTDLSGGTAKYIKIDSASSPLGSNKGLFVATSTAAGRFYYAVTATVGGVEDTTVIVGSNALASALLEDVEMPQPVWQESRLIGGRTFDIYVQFVTRVTSPVYPQMTNAGSFPFHFAIVKSGSSTPHPVTFSMHGQGSSFLEPAQKGIGHQNEWLVTIDDWLPNSEFDTYFYGYHENYDIHSDQNEVPASGVLHNYTAARVAHTVDWVLRNLPVDSTRTYMTGFSMGAIGTLLNALVIPARIAAIFVYAPRIDMSNFAAYDKFGAPETDLFTNEGFHKKVRLNATSLAALHRSGFLPIMYTFSGKMDINVGWSDKPSFYDSLNDYRHGGYYFWSNTDHSETGDNNPWKPSFPDFSFFTRYRTNLSYPAFSNCSINDNPGNGSPSDGASLGAINGHLDWNDNIVDSTDRWEITLRLKDLATTAGADIAPDSATTDVTLRRLQKFAPPMGSMLAWKNIKDSVYDEDEKAFQDSVVIQGDSSKYNGDLITIPAFQVFKSSSRLVVSWHLITGVDNGLSLPSRYMLEQNYPNPFNPKTVVSCQWPVASWVKLVVYDLLGREVAVLLDEQKAPGRYQVEFDGTRLSSGVYFCRLTAGDYMETKRMVLVR